MTGNDSLRLDGAGDAAAPAEANRGGDKGLDARLVVDRGAFRLEAGLRARPGEVVAVLGPNGSGKSTALRALAGLESLSSGRILLGGRDITVAPAERRPVGMVFQDYLLFGHLSALDNVAFGPRCAGAGRAEARALAAELLETVGLADHAAARPRALSGGQAQRVALARALAVRPRLLLLDEPMAALDVHTRASVRSWLRHRLAALDYATVLVTHDPLDAMVLADRITVLESGRVVQEGAPGEVAQHPRTGYVARLVGLNLYRGSAQGTRVRVPVSDGFGAAEISLPQRWEGEVFVAFPPRAVALYRERPDGTPRNLWRLRIDGVERFGDQVRVHLVGAFPLLADITPEALAELRLAGGMEVWAGVKATEVRCYPA
ncbi:ABC transporter ATP-binding protein [Streptomonospora litoralis]|uniref:Sulfate/thiosulfate import ATP-binding protein CysA n=1 Tax=Streptomonospora litoralis TaxID=2498135 RepID=A0A4P6Q9H9_9ACTN|nr:ABC transporter ATP-binding protein [Streptomonospora litoralis]QBI55914.1 Sulfate/thiosulfate import ATP-binding protein CysA [Streptomonospora litoralis]